MNSENSDDAGQLPLPGVAISKKRRAAKQLPGPAPEFPVAKVAVDAPTEHLAGAYDYGVTADLHESCVPGVQVRVRFGRIRTTGYVLERLVASDYAGELVNIERVMTSQPVVTPAVFAAAADLCALYGGDLMDVLRFAVPRRHVAAAKAHREAAPSLDVPQLAGANPWQTYSAGEAFLGHLAAGENPISVAEYLAGFVDNHPTWAVQLVWAVVAALRSGRSAVVVVPDHRALDALTLTWDELTESADRTVLRAADSDAERYTQFLTVRSGEARVVFGTRSAAWAPARNLGLVAVHDPAHAALQEPRTPYPSVVDVAALRAKHEGAALLLAGHVLTPRLVLATEELALPVLRADTRPAREAGPRVRIAGAPTERDPLADRRRIPTAVIEALRESVTQGPVLVQVPRRGHHVRASCKTCGQPASCAVCGNPLTADSGARALHCVQCGHVEAPWRCGSCDGLTWTLGIVGAERTVSDIGRMLPGCRIIAATGDDRVLRVTGQPRQVVVATPGAEPLAEGGYQAVAVLDAWLQWSRAEIDTDIEALHAWSVGRAAATGRAKGGQMLIVGKDPQGMVASLQTMTMWNKVAQIAAERVELGAEPAVPAVHVSGAVQTVTDFVGALQLGHEWLRLGPVFDEATGEGSMLVRHGVVTPDERLAAQRELAAEVRRLRRRWSQAGKTNPTTKVRAAAWPVAASRNVL